MNHNQLASSPSSGGGERGLQQTTIRTTFEPNNVATSSTSQPQPVPELGAMPRKGQKRPHSLVCNGSQDTFGENPVISSINCPICMEILKEAVITKCGHTFCDACIKTSLAVKPMCPQCGTVEHEDNLIPNNIANELVSRRAPSSKKTRTDVYEVAKLNDASPSDMLHSLSSGDLNLNNIDSLIMLLQRKREVLTSESRIHEKALLTEFLNQLLKVKKAEKEKIDKEVHLIEQDLNHTNKTPLEELSGLADSSPLESPKPESEADEGITMGASSCSSSGSVSDITGFNTQALSNLEMKDKSMAGKRKRMHSHFEELVDIYMNLRKAELHDVRDNCNDATVPNDESMDYEALDGFGLTLSRISKYSALKPLATLTYSADLLSNNNIVSSIEFDKDNEYFAIAGVTKKIKLFEYATVIGSSVDIHCPTAELMCSSKISCVSWSGYYKNRLASSDYDGSVSLWDSAMSTRTSVLNEHEKRVWSVDWSNGDPRLLASGSDDSKVKLWSTNASRSVATIEARANVCCVKFCPQNSFVVAFGCADHKIHYYDFRHPRQPLAILAGHKKAVSYVKFASKDELVSASTDSHLKLWNLESQSTECVRSYTGHTNEKNFVGLATDGNYIACGSENNSLYIYYRHLSRPLLHFKFDNHRNMLEKPKSDDAGEFVSAVVWKKGSPTVIAANSQGSIKILELT